jgi:hypothetical protein
MPELATLGDFDGDLLLDVAVSVNTGDDDELVVLWGQPNGAPVRSAPLTTMASIRQLEVTHSALRPDSVEDLIVVGNVNESDGSRPRRAAVFFGNTNRQLLAPLELESATQALRPTRLSLAPVDADEDNHTDIVALSSAEDKNALWLLPSYGEGEVQAPDTWRSAELAPGLVGQAALLVSGDLDDDERAEQIVLGTTTASIQDRTVYPGFLQLARFTDGEWRLDEPQNLEAFFWFAPDAASSSEAWPYLLDQSTPTCGRSQAVLAEIDGQPGFDLVALGMVRDFVQVALHRIVVVPGDGAGGLDASRTIKLESFVPSVAGAVEPLAFALLNADSDADLEIALLDEGGIFVAEFDLAGQALIEARRVGGFDFHVAPPGECANALRGALVAGDVDRDGVDDLVVGGLDSIVTLRGMPIRE